MLDVGKVETGMWGSYMGAAKNVSRIRAFRDSDSQVDSQPETVYAKRVCDWFEVTQSQNFRAFRIRVTGVTR